MQSSMFVVNFTVLYIIPGFWSNLWRHILLKMGTFLHWVIKFDG